MLQKSVSNLRGYNITNDVSTSKVVQHALPADRFSLIFQLTNYFLVNLIKNKL
jgi:hypothetical protein